MANTRDHDYRIAPVTTTDGRRWEAWCQRCPWTGPLRIDLRDAHTDGLGHEKHPPQEG